MYLDGLFYPVPSSSTAVTSGAFSLTTEKQQNIAGGIPTKQVMYMHFVAAMLANPHCLTMNTIEIEQRARDMIQTIRNAPEL